MPEIEKKKWDELLLLIKSSQNILLSTHSNADGDGLGSEIAFYYYLKSLNKDCRIINPTPLSYNYKSLDPDDIVEVYSNSMNDFINKIDLTIIFDIGDHKRIGNIGKQIYGKCTSISIDHHPPKKDHPFDFTVIDSDAPATGYLIWKYFQHIGFTDTKMSINIANALYASVVTDTGSFKYQSTTSDTHYMAAYLIESGINGYEIQKNIYEQRKLSQVKLMGEVIQSLQYSTTGDIVWAIITQNMIKKVKGSDEDVDGFTEYLRSIQGVEISFIVIEKADSTHRISFRSSGKYSINDVAQIFNGGGHKFAAGAMIKDISATDIVKNVITQLERKINGDF